MKIPFLLATAVLATTALTSAAEWVDPSTPSAPKEVPQGPVKPSKAPPECVSRVLELVYAQEKAYFAEKKAYAESLFEIHATSKVGVGCPGWSLPAVALTYGGSGFTATMRESETGVRYIINQDRTIILEEEKIKAEAK